jgi:hypothetical protein
MCQPVAAAKIAGKCQQVARRDGRSHPDNNGQGS